MGSSCKSKQIAQATTGVFRSDIFWVPLSAGALAGLYGPRENIREGLYPQEA